jgi:hypothetical protein
LAWRHNDWEGAPNGPNWLFFAMHKIFFGAIWCDLVRFAAISAFLLSHGDGFSAPPAVGDTIAAKGVPEGPNWLFFAIHKIF